MDQLEIPFPDDEPEFLADFDQCDDMDGLSAEEWEAAIERYFEEQDTA